MDDDQDEFILLLNPAVGIQQVPIFNSDQECISAGSLNWYFGVNPATLNGEAVRYNLSVGELKNPQSMPVDVARQLQILEFTNADYQTILSLDPFANGSPTIDETRFFATTTSFPYEPPPQSPACNNGKCTCDSLAQSIKNDFLKDMGTSTKKEYKVGLSASLSGTLLSWIKLTGTADADLYLD